MLTDSQDHLVAALIALRDGRPALTEATKAAESGSRLGAELAVHLGENDLGGRVYDQPAAFTTFIREGGNVGLYETLSARLAEIYDERKPKTVLDLGCGDGLALVPALERAAHRPRPYLVEPSAALLETAVARVAELDGVEATAYETTAQKYFAEQTHRVELAQSTFALQSLRPEDRPAVFRSLRDTAAEVVIAEFDVSVMAEGSLEHVASLATRYERGIAEYGEHARLVAQGFLLPMLLGLLNPDSPRNNWEQPAAQWAEQLTAAGFGTVEVAPLADYWWSPAVLIHAR